jgi:hypothetical protein
MSDRVNLDRVIRLSLPFNFRFAPKVTANREGNDDQITRREYEIPIESAYFFQMPWHNRNSPAHNLTCRVLFLAVRRKIFSTASCRSAALCGHGVNDRPQQRRPAVLRAVPTDLQHQIDRIWHANGRALEVGRTGPLPQLHVGVAPVIEMHDISTQIHVVAVRSDRSRRIDTWSMSAQTRHRLPWIYGTEPERRWWSDRSAPPRGRRRGSLSGAGTPHRLAR